MLPRQPRSPYGTRPSRLNTIDEAIREFWDGFYDCFAYFLEFGGGCITAKSDAFEIREFNRDVEWPREFFIDEGFHPGAQIFKLLWLQYIISLLVYH